MKNLQVRVGDMNRNKEVIKEWKFRGIIGKNSKESEVARAKGNNMYLKGKHTDNAHEEIWKLYSQSIALAERESHELALAYGNRSALLLHLCKYQECIQDIDRALKITKQDSFKVKLFCRKAECLHALGSKDAKTALEEAKLTLSEVKKGDLAGLSSMVDKTKLIIDKKHRVSILHEANAKNSLIMLCFVVIDDYTQLNF